MLDATKPNEAHEDEPTAKMNERSIALHKALVDLCVKEFTIDEKGIVNTEDDDTIAVVMSALTVTAGTMLAMAQIDPMYFAYRVSQACAAETERLEAAIEQNKAESAKATEQG